MLDFSFFFLPFIKGENAFSSNIGSVNTFFVYLFIASCAPVYTETCTKKSDVTVSTAKKCIAEILTRTQCWNVI